MLYIHTIWMSILQWLRAQRAHPCLNIKPNSTLACAALFNNTMIFCHIMEANICRRANNRFFFFIIKCSRPYIYICMYISIWLLCFSFYFHAKVTKQILLCARVSVRLNHLKSSARAGHYEPFFGHYVVVDVYNKNK